MERESLYKPDTSWAGKHGQPENELIEDSVFFTILRQHGASVRMLGLVLKNQCQHAIPVSEIEEIYYEPARGIILFLRFGVIRIEGRNLEPLYLYLREQKVVEIRGFSRKSEAFFDEKALLVSAIHYESENLQRLQL
jgi:hypothetical protein